MTTNHRITCLNGQQTFSSYPNNPTTYISDKYIARINPFLANIPPENTPENTKKPLVFWCFQGVLNGIIRQKRVKS